MVSGSLRVKETEDGLGPAEHRDPKSPRKKDEDEELGEAKVSPLNAPARLKLINVAAAIFPFFFPEKLIKIRIDKDNTRFNNVGFIFFSR